MIFEELYVSKGFGWCLKQNPRKNFQVNWKETKVLGAVFSGLKWITNTQRPIVYLHKQQNIWDEYAKYVQS